MTSPHARVPPEGVLRDRSLPHKGAGRERPGKAGSAAPLTFEGAGRAPAAGKLHA